MKELVQIEWVGPVAVLTLNRPERHNSLIPELLEMLLDRIEKVKTEPDARAMVLQANGRSFSTGGDVAGFATHLDSIEGYAHRIVGLLNQAILALLNLPIPVVAAVQGIVTGGSMGLVMACDLVLVTPKTTFTPYYSVVGFSPDGGWTAMLPAIIGLKRTAAILLQNKSISAEEALNWGLAGQIVESGLVRQEALMAAQDIANKKAGSIRHTKRLLVDSLGDVTSGLEEERVRFVRQISTPEAQEGMANFLRRQDD
jgi:enoyl-CoA hydratase/carnithine racemase